MHLHVYNFCGYKDVFVTQREYPLIDFFARKENMEVGFSETKGRPWIEDGKREYKKRLKPFLKWMNAPRESSLIIEVNPLGREIGSKELSDLIEEYKVSGVSSFYFVFPGDLDKAKKRISIQLCNQDLPRDIQELMLIEQIYRIVMIINGSPYHK